MQNACNSIPSHETCHIMFDDCMNLIIVIIIIVLFYVVVVVVVVVDFNSLK
jgi:hypothetical protein